MSKVKFLVRSKTKGQPATVYLRYYDSNRVDVKIPTMFKIYPEYWNNKSQSFNKRILYSNSFTEADKTNIENRLIDLKSHLLKKANSGIAMNKKSLAKIIYEFHNGKSAGDKNTTLNQYIDHFISECQNGKRLTEKKTLFAESTIRTLKGFRSQFQNYQSVKRNRIDFDDVTLNFYNSFIQFFTKKDYSPNTIGKYIKHLKMIMRAARDSGLHNNSVFEMKSFKPPNAKVTNIYLNENELDKIYHLELSSKPLLDLARDVFLVGCYTAQRYSDYSQISSENIKDGYIELTQQKTGETVIVPIRPELNALLKKYNNNLPKTHQQKVNDRIKEVAKLAGIDDLITIELIRGGKRRKKTVPKYTLIKTHTARRSGCTNMYLAGIPTIDIMKISGHKTESEFLKYINVTKQETAKNLASHPYFTGGNIYN